MATFFFLPGEWKGESEALAGGGGFVSFPPKIPKGGVVSEDGGGQEGVCGELGGGAKYLFLGRNSR